MQYLLTVNTKLQFFLHESLFIIRELLHDSLCFRHSRATMCDQREPYSRMRASDEVSATHERDEQSMLGRGSYGMTKGRLIRNYLAGGV